MIFPVNPVVYILFFLPYDTTMLYIATILSTIGVTSVEMRQQNDPETKEEFTKNCICDATWEQYVAARDVYMPIVGEKLIRRHRDRLLAESDWVETPYSQSTLANLDEWNTYRQCLRDLPSQASKLTWKGGAPDFSSLSILPLPQTIRKK